MLHRTYCVARERSTFLSLFIGDFALLSRDPIVGGRLPAILELLRKYGGNSGIVRVHGPLFQSFVFISDPELVRAHCLATHLMSSVIYTIV